jgi:hypothetical protein
MCGTWRGSTPRPAGDVIGSHRQSQEVEPAERRLCIGTKKAVRRRGVEDPGSFCAAWAVGRGGVNAALIDTRRTPLYASSCNPFFGMRVMRSVDLEDVQGD